MSEVDAILVAGGRSSRMAGTDKLLLELDGRSLLERAVSAVTNAGCRTVTVVGPPRTFPAEGAAALTFVREDPPFAGPVAAIAAGLVVGTADWVLVLATDLPGIDAGVELLVTAVDHDPESSAHIVVDRSGQAQWLLSIVRREVLVRSIAGLAPQNASMRELFAGIDAAEHHDDRGISDDVDTWDDWERAQERHRDLM